MKSKFKRITDLTNKPFLKNIMMLTGGTAGGQLILVLVSPILTRIYSPEDFGVLAIYTSILSILVVVVSLRYGLAILVARTYKTALELFSISLIITTFISFITFLLILFFGDEIMHFLNLKVSKFYFYLLPFSLFFLGIYGVFSQLAVRKEKYSVIAKTKFVQSCVLGLSQVVFGFIFRGTGGVGLLIGDTIGRFSGNIKMLTILSEHDKKEIRRFKPITLLKTARAYIKFPLYSSFSALMNNSILQMPPLLLAITYTQNIVGLFALAQRVVGVPMKMIGQSVAQVYLGECAKLSRENPNQLLKLFINITTKLFLLALLPFIIMLLGAPKIFEIIFGGEWIEAGYYIQLLSGMYFIQFIVFPLSQTLEILGKQKTQLFWQTARGIIIFGALFIPPNLGMSASQTIFSYGLAMTITYILLYITILIQIKKLINTSKSRFV